MFFAASRRKHNKTWSSITPTGTHYHVFHFICHIWNKETVRNGFVFLKIQADEDTVYETNVPLSSTELSMTLTV